MVAHQPSIRLALPLAKPATWETVLIPALLLLLGTNLIPVILGGGTDGEANPVRLARYGYLAIYVAALLMLTCRIKTLSMFINTAPLLGIILVYPFLSILWSNSPVESFQRGVAVLCPSLIGIYMAERFDLRSIILLLAGAYALIAMVDFVAASGLPSIGRMTEQEWHGAWRGFHGHKTGLGKSAFVGAVFSLYAIILTRGKLQGFFIGITSLQLLLLMQARSTAALLSLGITLAFMVWLFTMKQRNRALLWLYSALVIIVSSLLALLLSGEGLGPILELLGKNQTMSSRLPLWDEVTISIAKSPWLGYGFSGFWQSNLPDIARIHSVLRFEPHYAHNGLLEMLLDGGVLFVALFTAQMITSITKASVLCARGAFYASLPLVFFLIFILSNFAEASVLPKNSLFWVAFVAIAAFTARSVRFATGADSVPLPHRQTKFSA